MRHEQDNFPYLLILRCKIKEKKKTTHLKISRKSLKTPDGIIPGPSPEFGEQEESLSSIWCPWPILTEIIVTVCVWCSEHRLTVQILLLMMYFLSLKITFYYQDNTCGSILTGWLASQPSRSQGNERSTEEALSPNLWLREQGSISPEKPGVKPLWGVSGWN